MNHILVGDCREIMPTLDADSFDAIITDPPYHLTTGKNGGSGAASLNKKSPAGRSRIGTGFMGKAWDGSDVAFQPETWAAALQVAKPGAHLLAFGGTRTFHRLMVAIEDAGWELRDTIMWIFGSGFPKSRNLEGEWKGWGTALKPAWEPIVVARKALVGTVAENVERYGTGAMNIDWCRVATDGPSPTVERRASARRNDWDATAGGITARETDAVGRLQRRGDPETFKRERPSEKLGRWPANLIHDGSEEVLAVFPDAPGALRAVGPEFAPKVGTDVYGDYGLRPVCEPRGDSGSAARFFYCAKADRQDRDEGCEALEKKPLLWSSGEQSPGTFQSENTDRAVRNHHPTVKPTALMRYLCKLVTPPGGKILDCFAGSGSTGKAGALEGFDVTMIEAESEYAEIAKARSDYVNPAAMVLT